MNAENNEVTIQDILMARLRAAIHCVNLNDLEGCKYSLLMALEVIEENKIQQSENQRTKE